MLIPDLGNYIKKVAQKQVHVPTLMIGSMGIGKSMIVEQVVKELQKDTGEEWGFVDLRLATQEPGDLIGYPYIEEKKLENGVKVKTTNHAMPAWFPQPGTKGILFMDELNRAQQDVRQAVFQIINARRLHTHKLPDGWYIVSAINPENGQYQVETLDKAMMRRFCVLKASTDVESWLRWGKQVGIDEKIIGFIAAHGDLLTKDEPVDFDIQYNPAGYAAFSSLLQGGCVSPEYFNEVSIGCVGREAAIALTKYCDEEYKKPVSGREVLTNFDKVEKRLMKQKNDEWFVTLRELSAELQADDKPTANKLENLVKFILKAPAEITATIMSKLPGNYLGEIMSNRDVTKRVSQTVREARK